jgi:uncharacterized membrane protein YbaN (DUF454 family)
MRALYLVLASLFFLLALLGAFLPLLPTTPFLLLTSLCLLRSSPALNDRLKRSALFGPFLRDWEAHHGVRPHVKITALVTMTLAVAASLWFGRLGTASTIVLVVLALVGVVVVLRLRTISDDPKP